MNGNFNFEFSDVIQYLNSFVIKKSERINLQFKNKTITQEDLENCLIAINDLIKLVNKKIKNNQYNQYSTNVSSFDGFEKVQRELGLPISLYPKINYNRKIILVDFSIIASFYGNINQYGKLINCYFYKVNVSITREKVSNSDSPILNFNIDFLNLKNSFSNSNIIYNILIKNLFVKQINEELYFSNNKNNFSDLNDNMIMTQELFNEVKDKRDLQNEIMQSSVNGFL